MTNSQGNDVMQRHTYRYVTPELKTRIMRILGREKLYVLEEEIWNSESQLEKRMGIRFGARGVVLYLAFLELVNEKKIIAFRIDGDLAFMTHSCWEKDIEAEPELIEAQVINLHPYTSLETALPQNRG